ncbi:MAG TPA: CehA/McbA family metallohydrolase [Steroidobacteraceae bacterium]|nr:CehA/McbA family metallohydrolase [Steroidobacteraceae bacterium]
MRVTPILLALLCLLLALPGAHAQVRLLVGPTPIPQGNAHAAGDLTVVNERLAFALAVESAPPYGVPRGALVAIAPVRAGQIARNRVAFADFVPNGWSAWPNTSHHVDVLERGPRQVRIRTVRNYGDATITTLYTLSAGSDRIAISTTMSNGGKRALTGLLSGLTLWPNSGFLFAVPGLAGVSEGKADGALSDRVVAYDADWTVTLHAPYFDHVTSGSRDLLRLHTLQPGESRSFNGWLQVGSSGDLAPVVAAEIAQRKLRSGSVHGTVLDHDGVPLAQPVVVIEKDGQPYAWVLGHDGSYRLSLPEGDYTLYTTGRNYSRSPAQPLKVAAGSEQACSFRDLDGAGRLEFEVVDARSGAPLDARITIAQGDRPFPAFLGRGTIFTELARHGYAELSSAPGDYVFRVSSGGGFVAADGEARVHVETGKLSKSRITITRWFDPRARGWYAADLHHHADQAEAVTPPEDLARSQLAAGLDVLFVSDHDSTANHAALRAIAAARAMPFIAGIELSPSWGHFNAYPLTPGATPAIDTSAASVDMILREARREGASVVQVNHPFVSYGYFSSLEANAAPGGFDPAFDLIEINARASADDQKVLSRVWAFWNTGAHYYLSAGSDTHDVWNEESGRVRAYVHPDGPLSAQSFVAALKAGHAYVTYGPLIFPTVMFGSAVADTADKPLSAAFTIASVAGLKQVELVGGGAVQFVRTFPDAPRETQVSFALAPERAWYALVVEDQRGRRAYTDPIWVSAPGTPLRQEAPRP